MADRYTVYGLADPRQPEDIRYVGATSQSLEKRLAQHCGDTKRGDRKSQWLRRIMRDGFKPLIIPLEECSEGDVREVEGRWIGNFRMCYKPHLQMNGTSPAFKPGNYYLNQRLIHWRKDLTQKEAAAILSVSVNTYRNWEYGINIPSAMAMKEIDRMLQQPAETYLQK